MRIIAIATSIAVLVAGGAALARYSREAPVATPTGAPRACVPLTQLRESRVRNDQVIDFRVSGNRWYRNTLPHRCPGLGSEERFSYETSLSELCSTDIIHVLHTYGGHLDRGAGCGLGKFQPVEIARKPR